jgi:hypothetical protein
MTNGLGGCRFNVRGSDSHGTIKSQLTFGRNVQYECRSNSENLVCTYTLATYGQISIWYQNRFLAFQNSTKIEYQSHKTTPPPQRRTTENNKFKPNGRFHPCVTQSNFPGNIIAPSQSWGGQPFVLLVALGRTNNPRI